MFVVGASLRENDGGAPDQNYQYSKLHKEMKGRLIDHTHRLHTIEGHQGVQDYLPRHQAHIQADELVFASIYLHEVLHLW